MAKWETSLFRMKLDNGDTRPACGPAYKGLCLLRVKKGTWRLMHMNSGNGVVGLDGDYFTIRRISVDIANLIDWTGMKTAEEILAVDGLGARIDAVVRSWKGEDVMEAGHA